MRTLPLLICLLSMATPSAALAAHGGAVAPEISDCAIDGDRVTLTLHAQPFEVLETDTGQRLTMNAFGNLGIPGAPLLPMKRFLVALPPGARATSIEVLDTHTSTLRGIYQLDPCPPIALLSDMPGWEEAMRELELEWQAEHDAAYSTAAPFPREIAWLAGAGSLRKYAYAAVAFCPFTYHPQSGRLEHHSEVRIAIQCDMPGDSDPETELVQELLRDSVADARASGLFSNYQQVAPLYQPVESEPPASAATYDYVIITVDALQDAINASEFPAWKSAQGFNLRTVLMTDGEITSQPGSDEAEKVRNFLRGHYATWGIEYVLMVGDYATVPMRICFPDPDFHVYDPGNPGLVAPGTPTDYYYADLSFPDAVSWDLDGDGFHGEYSDDLPDFLAEVAVGRIPVNDPARITYALDKLVAFEQDDGTWKNNVLHAGSILFFENQNQTEVPFIDGSTCLDSLETGLMAGCNITHLTERAGIVPSHFDWFPLTEQTFTASWRSGQHAIVNWSGHGSPDGVYRTIWAWDDGDGIPESGNGELQSHRFIGIGSDLEDDHPSIVFAISCNVGYPEPNPQGNLGIDLLTLPGWGSAAGIVSSARPAAISGDWKNAPGGTEQICYEFNRCTMVEKDCIGDALYIGKFQANLHYGWERVYEYMNLYNFNLFGDPSLDIQRATTGVADADAAAPVRLRLDLRSSSANPFASIARFRVVAPGVQMVRAAVYDVRGRHMADLAGGRAIGEVAWDGRRDDGGLAGSGTYFLVVEAGGELVTRKLVLLR